MKLSKEDADQVHRSISLLLHEANRESKLIEHLDTRNIERVQLDNALKLQDMIFQGGDFIDSFVKRKGAALKSGDLDVLKGWSRHVNDHFLLMQHSKEGSKFLHLDRNGKQTAYLVIGMYQDIEEVLNGPLPIFLQTVLLPYKGRVTYTGLVHYDEVSFGGSMARDIKAIYERTLTTRGLVVSFDETPRPPSSQEVLLKFMRTTESRHMHAEDLDELLAKEPSLYPLYCRELGRINSRGLRKKLVAIGALPSHVAVMNDIIVATAQNLKELEKRVGEIMPREERDRVFIFRFKGARSGEKEETA